MKKNTFDKSQHLCSKKRIDTLFNGSSSFVVYPLKVIYRTEEDHKDIPSIQLLLSVSKRRFKRAVKRNRVKRQLREAYRKNCLSIKQLVIQKSIHLDIAFLWLSYDLHPSEEIEKKVAKALDIISSNLQNKDTEKDTSDI